MIILNTLNINENFQAVTSHVNKKYYVFLDGHFHELTTNKENVFQNGVTMELLNQVIEDNAVLTKIIIRNESANVFDMKLFVESNLHGPDQHKYVFVSPRQDVMFLANENRLFLTSGILKKKSFSQYGVIKKSEILDSIHTGSIPYRPIGSGSVAGMFSLEQELQAYEKTTAFTWALSSTVFSEQRLLNKDKQLKSRLAFLDK